MKTRIQIELAVATISLAWLCAVPNSGAATLTPGATGDAAVAAATSGRPNLALATGGAVAFSSSDLTPAYAAPRVNDGVINHSGNSWIPVTTASTEFVGVAFPAPITLAAVVWHGQTGYNGRSGGTWRLEYTSDSSPSGSSTWTEIGTYIYSEAGCGSPMPRTLFSFGSVANVTGMRLVLANSACGIQLAVQEFEAYAPVSSPPSITSQAAGGTVVAGGDFTFSVLADGAEFFQWRKDNVDIPGATGPNYTISDVKASDAGTYIVKVRNSSGSVISDPAVLDVTPAQTFNSYAEAILTDNPIHYYPLDETSGTVAEDLGSLATTGGTYTGGFLVGQPAATERLGKRVQLDGAPGSFVDLGLFHPGNAVTVEAWVRLDSDARSASYHALIARWDGSYELDFAPGDYANFVVRRDGNGFGLAAAAAPSTRAQWHHLVGIFGNGVLTIFVDGVKGSEQNLGGMLQDAGPAPDRVMIGATRSGTASSFNFKGGIDEVAVYDYALSAAQVRGHFRAAQPPAPPALTIQHAVIVSWPSFPPGYVLQEASDVGGPYQDYTGPTYPDGSTINAPVPLGPTQKFYKLVKP